MDEKNIITREAFFENGQQDAKIGGLVNLETFCAKLFFCVWPKTFSLPPKRSRKFAQKRSSSDWWFGKLAKKLAKKR